MSKSNATELDFLKYIFNATAIPWAGLGNLYVSLHTGDPGEGGDQQTNECAYTGYARVTVARDAGGWNTAANPISNVAEITFPQCTGGTETATHVAVGTTTTGNAGQILYSGILSAPLAISNLITPRIIAAALQVSED
jgi:hypothetical protein